MKRQQQLPGVTVCLVFQATAFPPLNDISVEGANALPVGVIQDEFKDQVNKTANRRDIIQSVINLNQWYADRGIYGEVCVCVLLCCV